MRLVRPLTIGTGVLLFLLSPLSASAQLVVGPGAGSPPDVRLIDATGERSVPTFDPAFLSGVSVTLGDVDGDGTADIIAAAGPGGGPHVLVLSGTDLHVLASFFAYSPAFAGGVHVAAGDVDGDGRADIITGAGAGGGPHVQVFSGADLRVLASFYAYNPAFDGGVQVAAGDVDGDGRADIVTGAGPGGGPHVQVFSGADLRVLASFFAYAPAFGGGVSVAAGDLDGDGLSDLITGAGPGGGPHVQVFSGADLHLLASFYAYNPAFAGGVQVAAGDINGDGRTDLITGAGPGGGPHVRVFSGVDLSELASFFAFGTGSSGVSIGSRGDTAGVRFTSAASASFTAGSAGTFTVTTSGVPTPALTVSGTLPTGVTFTDHADGTATLAGTPGASTGGSYPLTFTATPSGRPAVTQSFTLTITQGPAITSATATTFGLGGLGTFTVTTTGFPTPTVSSTGALPTGVTLTPNADGTATLAGTPAPGSGGTYPLTITATNGSGPDATQAFVLTVNNSPAFTSATTTTFTVGVAGTFTVATAGSPTPALAVTGALPAGVTFVDNGNGTGTLSGTPAAGTGGAYPMTFTASNGVPPNGTQAFTLTVTQAPAVTSASSTTFTVGSAGSFTVTTSGFPAAALARGGVALPSGVTFVDNGNGTGTLSGTPAAGTGGTYAITFTATNTAGSSAPQAFTLTVNGAPAITSATATTFTVGSAGTFTVTTSGSPTPGITITGALPTGVTFLDNGNGTGTLSGTPAAGTGGTYALTFTAANGVLPNGTQAFTLTVTQAPAITSATSTTMSIGTAGSFTVTTSGFPAPTVIVGGAALPAGVTFVDNGNGTGTLSGTPAAGTGGTYALTFTATNTAGSTAPQAFTLTVNQAPTITSAPSTSFTIGVAGTFTVTTTASPVAAITRTGVALPSGVTFADNGDGTGTLSGTPAAGTAGAYAFTFTAANGVSPDAVQAFTLNVQQEPAITSVATDTFIVGTADSFTVTTTGFPAPTVTQTGTLPTGVTFTPATRVLAGTATQTGVFPLQFTAANGVVPDAVQNFTLNVVCPAITVTPATLTDGLYQTLYGTVDFNATGSTGSAFTWTATGLPTGLSIDVSTGVVSGTPTNTVLNAPVAVSVTDNFGCPGSINTTLTVRPTTDNENYTGGVGNTQYVVGAAVPSTPYVFVNDNVKTGDNGPGTLTVAFNAPANGAIVEGTPDGTFTYTPNAGFAGSSDTFTYTLTDGNGVTNTATVTINLSGMVWYVNSASPNGDGRSNLPFSALNNAAAPSAAGSFIYVHTGGATTTGSLAMDANQTLVGQGVAFTLNSLTIPAGTRPTLTGTVTLANSDAVTGVNFSGAAPAMTASGLTQAVTIDQVNVTGGTTALSLTNVSGAVTVTNATFTNTTGAEVLINQGTGAVSLGAVISSNAGRSIDIQNRTGGTVTFTGAITDTGTGIVLTANTGSTITFTGGLALSTGTNPAFTATGGGTVSATQNNTTIVNTVATTTGIAVTIANTTIGAGGFTVRSIAANGAASGIVLNNTGTTGGVTVTGDGNTAQGGNASGGLIQNTTSVGISLTNAANLSFNNMHLNFTGSHGVNGTGVMNFSFTNGRINEAGTTGVSDESCVSFDDLDASNIRGTFTFTNNQCTLTEANGIDIQNWGATLSDVTISGNQFTDKGDVATPGSAVLLIGNSSASVSGVVTRATLSNNTITDFRAGAGFVLQANADAAGARPVTYGIPGSATDVIAVTGNQMDGGNGGIGNQPDRFVTGGINRSGQGNYNVSSNGTALNRIRNIDCIAIELQADGPVTVTTTVQNNFINPNSAVGCAGIAIGTDDPGNIGVLGTHTTLISGNNVMGTDGPGIYAIVRASVSSMTARILNNTVAAPIATNAARAGIRVDSGSAAGNTTMCVQISGNVTAGSTNTATATTSPGINLRKQGTVATTNVFGIVGLSPSPTGTPNVENHVNALNTSTSGTFGVGGTALLSGTSGFVSCVIP